LAGFIFGKETPNLCEPYIGVDDCPCFIPVDCKITKFSLTLVCLHIFGNNYNIGELTSATSKERMTMNIVFVGATPIN